MSGRLSPARVALAYVVFSVLALALFAVPLWHAWRVNVGTLRVFVPEDMQALPDLFHREGARCGRRRRALAIGPDRSTK